MKENLIHQIKAECMLIDKEIKTLQRLATLSGGYVTDRAIGFSINKLEEARMWLGKALGPLPEECRDEPGDVDYHERGF